MSLLIVEFSLIRSRPTGMRRATRHFCYGQPAVAGRDSWAGDAWPRHETAASTFWAGCRRRRRSARVNLGDCPDARRQIDSVVGAPVSRAAATSALPLSVQGMEPPDKTGLRAAQMCALSAFSRTEPVVFPVRSRQISTGICSSDKPLFDALPPRLRGARNMPCFLPLNDSRENVPPAPAMPIKFVAFCRSGSVRKRCRQRNAVLRCTWQAWRFCERFALRPFVARTPAVCPCAAAPPAASTPAH